MNVGFGRCNHCAFEVRVGGDVTFAPFRRIDGRFVESVSIEEFGCDLQCERLVGGALCRIKERVG